MALGNLDNKKQYIMLIISVLAGVLAVVFIGGWYTAMIKAETERLALKHEKAQQQLARQYDEKMAAMQRQMMAEIDRRTQQAAADAAKNAAKPAVDTTASGAKRKPSLALRTPAGKRALTVLVDSLGAVGGLINPGDFVDLIAHMDVPSQKNSKDDKGKDKPKDKVTAMIFQNIQILAINTNLDDPGAYDAQQVEKTLKITFAVDPQEAGLLSFADKNGKIELSLRTPTEKGRAMLPSANWNTLAEYVLQNTGANIKGYDVSEEVVDEMTVETENVEETKPYIQIYRGGREL